MEHLQKAIGNLPVLAISSDACKGLDNAVKKVFPDAEHRECFFHLTKNFTKKFRGFGLSPAARTYREDIFYEKIASIISESPEPVQWLNKNHNLLWYMCAFNPEIKCDYITNNISESFNNRIHDYKDLPICDLADKIRGYIMDLWYRRRNIAVMVQLKANTKGLGP